MAMRRRWTPVLSVPLLSVLVLFLLPLSVHAQSAPGQATILSKQVAAALFAMDYAAWNANVDQATGSGQAKAIGDPATGLGMASTHEHGFMLVTPSYSSPGKPDSIQVMVGYEEPSSSSLSDDALQGILTKAADDLAPEYSVTGEFDRFVGGVGVFFLVIPVR